MWCVEWRRVVSWLVGEGAVSDHGVQGQDAAVCQGEHALAQGALPWCLRWYWEQETGSERSGAKVEGVT